MKIRTWIAVGGLGAYLLGQPALAGQIVVGDLQTVCTASDKEGKAICKFYILGVIEGLGVGLNSNLEGGNHPQFVAKEKVSLCVPEGLPGDLLEFLVKKQIGEDLMFYPEDKKLPAVSFIGGVIVRQYPCPQ